jgi:hypothetical protein
MGTYGTQKISSTSFLFHKKHKSKKYLTFFVPTLYRKKNFKKEQTMHCSPILVTFCIILNLYLSRYIIFQLIDIFLQPIVLFSNDAQQYIQQQINYSRDIKFCNETDLKYNLSQYEIECPQHRYNIQIISRRPLIIYIEQFLTPNEIQHLIELA